MSSSRSSRNNATTGSNSLNSPTNNDDLLRLQEELSTLRSQIAQLMSSNSTTAATSTKEPKMADVPVFNGDRKKTRDFLQKLSLVFSAQPARYNTDAAKVAYAASRLVDSAFSWFVPYLERNDVAMLNNYGTFKEAFISVFDDPDRIGTAERELEKLRQTGSCTTYAADFARLSNDLSWNEAARITAYYRGLKEDLKDELVRYERPTTLTEFVHLTIRLDNRMYERKREKLGKEFRARSFPPRMPTGSSNGSSVTYPNSESQGEPMKIGNLESRRKKLSKEEREHRIKNNLCLYCGTAGHSAVNCNKKPKNQKN